MGNHPSSSSSLPSPRFRRRFRPQSKAITTTSTSSNNKNDNNNDNNKAVQFHETTATTTTTTMTNPSQQETAATATTTPSSSSTTLWITNNNKNIHDFYCISSIELGRGHYGVVRKCQHLETGKWFAVKTIPKHKITTNNTQVLEREVQILQKIHHPHILQLEDIFEDETHLHFVTELCFGGELFDEILKRQHFSEQDAAMLMQDILQAIRYCHDDLHIVHRDLKPENFLIRDDYGASNKAKVLHIKIIDFGLSRFDIDEHTNAEAVVVMQTKVGTPYYVAPEVLKQRYTKACDMWSLGVITYILLCGYPPFYGDSDAEIFKSVLSAYYTFPSPEWDEVSETAKDFVRQLLQLDPSARMTASQALQHEFIVKHNNKNNTNNQKPPTAVVVVAPTKQQEKPQRKRRISVKRARYQRDRALRKLKKVTYAHLAKQQQQQLQDETSLSTTTTAEAFERQRLQRAFDFFVATNNIENGHQQGLTMENLYAILKHSGQAKELMNFIDTDRDGRISFDEFYQAITREEEEEEDEEKSSQ